jgi:hypothetical protein
MNVQAVPGIWAATSGAVYATGLLVCLILAPFGFAVAFAAGGALVLLNALASARSIKRAPFPHKGPVMASLLGWFYVRLAVLGICLFALIRYSRLDPLGLVAGLSVVPAGLFVMLALIYLANRRPEEV